MEAATKIKQNAFLAAPGKKKTLTLMALYIGLIASILTSATQSTMLPIAAQEIGGADYYTLVSTLSGVIGVMMLPLYGYITAQNPAIKGRLMGISLLINAAVFFSRVLATDMWQIIIPGMFYGLIPPTVYVVGYSFIRDIYDSKKAAYYLGFSATMVSIAQLAGPTVGGLIMDAGSWRYVNHLIWP
ncbi:MFS transporter, partial [Zhenpiania hominis]|uniref:MFS transporter n=1 Tax=Zhenpiania hominis TaxID=2763644 RepID=UPI0039F48D5B